MGEAARKLPASVYRCKGIIHDAEAPGRRVTLQVVGKRAYSAAGDRNGEEPRTCIVAIGAQGGVDTVAYSRQLFEPDRSAGTEACAGHKIQGRLQNSYLRELHELMAGREGARAPDLACDPQVRSCLLSVDRPAMTTMAPRWATPLVRCVRHLVPRSRRTPHRWAPGVRRDRRDFARHDGLPSTTLLAFELSRLRFCFDQRLVEFG
ncbi:GTP-binding protein [Rhizobium sp. WYCCWR 11146]|uniref:GTP-binding protein n=1 Tax=Rhizobium sp. WYCCWR 11146 TaxID=2749833 RepID=UPI001FEDE860|nr:GTP-binding protein [Rhizobium sp. WYCCWR 11146]